MLCIVTKISPNLISPSTRATLLEVVGGPIEAQHTAPCENICGKIFCQQCLQAKLAKISMYTVCGVSFTHPICSAVTIIVVITQMNHFSIPNFYGWNTLLGYNIHSLCFPQSSLYNGDLRRNVKEAGYGRNS